MEPLERLTAWLAGDLDPVEAGELAAALAQDPVLREQLAALQRADAALANLEPTAEPAGFAERLDARLADELATQLRPAPLRAVDGAAVSSEPASHTAVPLPVAATTPIPPPPPGPIPVIAAPTGAPPAGSPAGSRERRGWWIPVTAAAGLLLVAGSVAVVGGLVPTSGGDSDAITTAAEAFDPIEAQEAPAEDAMVEELELVPRDHASPESVEPAPDMFDDADGAVPAEELFDDADIAEAPPSDPGAPSFAGRSAPMVIDLGRSPDDDALTGLLELRVVTEVVAAQLPGEVGATLAAEGLAALAGADSVAGATDDAADADAPDADAGEIAPGAAISGAEVRCLDVLISDGLLPVYLERIVVDDRSALAVAAAATDAAGVYGRAVVWVVEVDGCGVRVVAER